MSVIDTDGGPVEKSGWALAAQVLIQLSVMLPLVMAVADVGLTGGRKLVVVVLGVSCYSAGTVSWPSAGSTGVCPRFPSPPP